METNNRRCETCNEVFNPEKVLAEAPQFLGAPHWYDRDAGRSCLPCFLGVGPLDIPLEK